MKLPQIKRKKGKGGRFEGNFYTFIDKLKVDLGTEDARVALKNLRRAVRGARTFETDSAAAAAATVEALDVAPLAPEGKQTSHDPPELETPKGSMLPIESPPAPPAGDWASDANAAAAAAGDAAQSSGPSAPPPPEAGPRIADVPMFAGAFVTLSKFLVAMQLRAQCAAARYIGDVELGPVGEPAGPPPQTMEDVHALLLKMAQPWDAYDPREPGRQIWEAFLKRICPETMPIPDWAAAPLMVALLTLPVQLMGMKKATKNPEPEQQETAAGIPTAAAA